MGLGNLMRAVVPRGTRLPESAPWVTQYGPWWGPWTGLPYSSDGTTPNYTSSWADATSATLAIPACWRATNLIAGFVAQMQLRGLKGDPPTEIDQNRQSLVNPWPLITYFDWMFGATCAILLRGNYYAVKADYDPDGNPRQYIPVANDDVTVNFEKGQLTYDVVGLDRSLRWNEMLHVRGFMMPGMLTGVGVIEAHRQGLASTRNLMDYGFGAYNSGAVPPVVMKVDKPELSEGEAEYLQSRWVQRHTSKDRRPAVIPKIVDIQTVGLSMHDAEYLESRQFSIAEIAYMFNLNPEDLSATFGGGGRGRIEYQNIEAKMRDRLIFSLNPWMSRIEQAFSLDMPGQWQARFNTADLFRADSHQRMQTYEVALRNKIYTLEEVRILEHMSTDDYKLHTDTEDLNIEWPPPEDKPQGGMMAPAQIGQPGAAGVDHPAMVAQRERVKAMLTKPKELPQEGGVS